MAADLEMLTLLFYQLPYCEITHQNFLLLSVYKQVFHLHESQKNTQDTHKSQGKGQILIEVFHVL
jgi:hypothetical protein